MGSHAIALCALAAVASLTPTTQSLTVTSPFNNPNTCVWNRDNCRQSDRCSRTTLHSNNNDVDIDEFKDINIDDVLLEAENALKAAESSLVDKDDERQTKTGDEDLVNFKEAVRDSLLSDDKGDKASIAVTEILSSTIGGILLGTILGSVAAFKLSNFDSTLSVEFALPVVLATGLGGIAGFSGSLQDDATGSIVRNVLGAPVKALASAIVTNIQEAARRQVEKTTNEIKAIPSNVANSAKQKAAQTAKEAKLAVELAVEDAIEKAKKVLLVMAVVSSVLALAILILNEGQISGVAQTSLGQLNSLAGL